MKGEVLHKYIIICGKSITLWGGATLLTINKSEGNHTKYVVIYFSLMQNMVLSLVPSLLFRT